MSIRQIIALAVCCLCRGTLCQCSSSSQADSNVHKSWTVICYWDGDNNLERDFLEAFLAAAKVGSDANVNVVIQLDRIPGNDDRFDDWTIAHRFVLTKDMTPVPQNAIIDWGDGLGGREVNMAEPVPPWT